MTYRIELLNHLLGHRSNMGGKPTLEEAREIAKLIAGRTRSFCTIEILDPKTLCPVVSIKGEC